MAAGGYEAREWKRAGLSTRATQGKQCSTCLLLLETTCGGRYLLLPSSLPPYELYDSTPLLSIRSLLLERGELTGKIRFPGISNGTSPLYRHSFPRVRACSFLFLASLITGVKVLFFECSPAGGGPELQAQANLLGMGDVEPGRSSTTIRTLSAEASLRGKVIWHGMCVRSSNLSRTLLPLS